MYAELYVAQHRAAPAAEGTANPHGDIGYFATFDDARTALDERYEPGCWQGICHDVTATLWWRDDHTGTWVGPLRRPRE